MVGLRFMMLMKLTSFITNMLNKRVKEKNFYVILIIFAGMEGDGDELRGKLL